jgi:arylformamidase
METRALIDLSHTIRHGTVTYPGLPSPVICDFLSREASRAHYAAGVEFHIGQITMVANSGTYLDSPFHRYADGKDLSQLPLEWIANLDGVRIRTDVPAIPAEIFRHLDLRGKAVVIQTGWSRHWGTERYLNGHPWVTEDAALYLRDAGARLVGIDSLNIDDTADKRRPAHSILLEAEIPIVEHLTNLDALPDTGFRFFAVPVKVRAFGTFPVRAFAVLNTQP